MKEIKVEYRYLGNSGIRVSVIGFGTWGLGGDSYGPVDDDVSQIVLNHALELGITFYDTSDLYGNGRSEVVLGKTFSNRREKVIIASKFGTLPHTGFYMPQEFSVSRIRMTLDATLKRLRTDYLDLYQLHSPPPDLPNYLEIISELEAIKQEGKIRAYGVSARSPLDAKGAIENYGFNIVQVNYNLIDQRAFNCGLFELCTLRNVGVIVRTPLSFGYLSGKLNGTEDLQGQDHRKHWPPDQVKRWAESIKLFKKLTEEADRTPAQLALQFCVSHEAVSTIIPGMMSVGEVQENCSVSELPRLKQPEIVLIRDIYNRNTFYDTSIKHKVNGKDDPR